jgi:molybdate transport system ATP-binding protein
VSLELRARLASRDIDVAIEVPTGQTLALLGANGAGKSSLLAILAGLLVPDMGWAQLNGRQLFDLGRPGRPQIWVPVHQRAIALLSQDPLLFPHLSVADNVAFGPRSRGRSRGESRAIAARVLAELGVGELAGRRPSQVSGGQAQRIAVARALAGEPDLLLLDEPLAALDVDGAAAVRQALRVVLQGRTVILVTHAILDAVLLADRIAVLEGGRVIEEGATRAVLRHPRSAFAASICGLNMLAGVATGTHQMRTNSGVVIHGQPDAPLRAGEPALAVFGPNAVSVHSSTPTGSPRNVLHGTVTALEPQANLIRVRVADLSADITPAAAAELGLAIGTAVHLAVKAAEVAIHHA